MSNSTDQRRSHGRRDRRRPPRTRRPRPSARWDTGQRDRHRHHTPTRGDGRADQPDLARACLLTHRALVLHYGLMVRADVISDELWALLEPVLPGVAGRPGRPWNDHRRTLEGIVWRFRTGSPWRDLPSEFGAYQSVWERHRRWSTDGTYNTMFAVVKADATDQDRQLMGTISVDSTSIRAHQHAAGARFHDHTGGTTE